MEYVALSSYKYMKPVLKQERRMIRKARNAKAIHDFTKFLIGLAAMYVGVFAAQHIAVWRPYVKEVLSATGLF
jgi:hypothetical protein